MRAFFAIELLEDPRDLLSEAASAFSDADPSWRAEKWVRADLLHVTLAFLPRLPEREVGRLVSEARADLASVAPFDLVLHGLRAVPSRGRARMLWASFVGPHGPCRRLASSVADSAGPHLDAGAVRPFTPHVTLARARRPRPADPAALAAGEAVVLSGGDARTVSVRAVTLFSSDLSGGGPTYTVLDEIPLARD